MKKVLTSMLFVGFLGNSVATMSTCAYNENCYYDCDSGSNLVSSYIQENSGEEKNSVGLVGWVTDEVYKLTKKLVGWGGELLKVYVIGNAAYTWWKNGNLDESALVGVLKKAKADVYNPAKVKIAEKFDLVKKLDQKKWKNMIAFLKEDPKSEKEGELLKAAMKEVARNGKDATLKMMQQLKDTVMENASGSLKDLK